MLSIYPDAAEKYIGQGDREATERMGDFIRRSLTLNETLWAEQNKDTRFEAGDQTIWNTYYNNWQVNPTQQFTFNHIRKIVSMVEGYQRAHRKSFICVPRENSDQLTADQFSELLLFLNDQEQIYESISNAFRGAVITGMNFLEVYMDYRRDPVNGDIKVDCAPYNAIIVDPFFTKMDLSDCNGIMKRTFVTPQEGASLLPEYKDEILSMQGFGPLEATFQFMPQNFQMTVGNLLTYDQFYYPTFREQRLLIDQKTGETAEWKSDNKEALREFLRAYPEIKMVKQDIPTTNLTIAVQGRVFYDGPQPMGIDRMPFCPVMAYYNPELEDFALRCAGYVRNLRDPQFIFNHRKVIELKILESQLNSGWIAEENAVVNTEDLFKTGEGQVIFTKKDKLGALQKIQPGRVDPSMMQISQEMKDEINQIANISDTLLGQSTDDLSGFHSQMRTASGIIANQRIFDQLDISQKILGDILIEAIQNNWTPGKVKRILNADPTEQFYNKTFGRYDCAIEEGYNTPTQKQMVFAQLLNLKKVGVPIPDDIMIENITMQRKTDLVETMQKQAQMAQQMQQRQMELQLLELEAKIKLANAQALADEGLGVERLSRVNENQALATERRAEAQKDRELGFLHLVKAIKEIQSIDLNQIEKILELGQRLQPEQEPIEERAQTVQEEIGIEEIPGPQGPPAV